MTDCPPLPKRLGGIATLAWLCSGRYYAHMHQGQPGTRKFRTLRHYDISGHAHYLTFSCWRNQPFLSKDRARGWFLQAVIKARRQHQFDLWAYMIMPEHVHLLLLPAADGEIAPIISSIKQSVAKSAVRWVRRNSPAFLARMLEVQPSGRRMFCGKMFAARYAADSPDQALTSSSSSTRNPDRPSCRAPG